MGPTLAAITFGVFILLDYFLRYRKERATSDAPIREVPLLNEAAQPIPEPVWVGGYEQPEDLSYHPGHTWVQVVSPDTVNVGVDDFGRRLVGKIDKLRLPSVGSWLFQGAKSAEIETDRGSTTLVAPVEGEVTRVNRDARKDPELTRIDPYRRGWLYSVRSANLANNLRNLMRGSLAKRWVEDEKTQLERRLMALSQTVFADGGVPAPDYADHLEKDEWADLTKRFLLN